MAPNASIVGEVSLGKNSSVWYGSVLRGDIAKIEIGEDSVIQDLVTIKGAAKIGRSVFVGPNCKLGACTLQDYSFVGMGATVEEGCVIESYGMVAAGAYVPKGTTVPSGQIFAGNPAAYLREVTSEERESVHEHINEMRNLAKIHSEEAEKDFEEVFRDDAARERRFYMNWSESFWEKFEKLGYMDHPIDHYEVEFARGTEYYSMNEREITETYRSESWRPFKEDGAVFPESWKIYGEDTERYERAKRMFEQPNERREEYRPSNIPTDSTPWTKRY